MKLPMSIRTRLPLLLILLLLILLVLAPVGLAADSDTLKKRRVSRTAGLSQHTYKQMQEIQTLIEEDKLTQAESKLKTMQDHSKTKLGNSCVFHAKADFQIKMNHPIEAELQIETMLIILAAITATTHYFCTVTISIYFWKTEINICTKYMEIVV